MSTAVTNHIVVDDMGVARVAGTTTKVVEILADYRFWGWSPETIHREYPYLSLAQIHAAFAYYYDHQDAMDAEMDQRERDMERMQSAQPETPGRRKLRDLGYRP